MKLKTSFRLLLFLVITFLFFIHTGTAFALEDFDPTKDYSVHSIPVLSPDSQVSIHSEDNSVENQQSPTLPLQTAKDVQNSPSNLKIATTNLTHFVQDHWRDFTSVLAVFLGTSTFGFFFFKRYMRSAVNSQIRFVGLVSAAVLSATSGVALLTAYNQQISFFENSTGWQFTPLGEDIFIIGGVLFTGLLFFVGPPLLSGVKSLATLSPAFAPKWGKIFGYFTKESKSAFTETEKECEDTINNCSSLFDKTVILLFNYLPGNMPDLGMDDAIINFKNGLFKTPQPQKVK